MKITDLPFNRFIGIDKRGENVGLTKHDRLLNHVGSLHAAALYGLAEAATGDWIIEHLMAHYPDALALAREGNIKYKRPAAEDCHAVVDVDQMAVEKCLSMLQRRGQGTLMISVQILSGDTLIATAAFKWWFSLK
ncbi:PaaI family thioesterase [Mariprofundus sp. NF]|uniref:PaaI family thioesterase n=1 Tax=Mariprofundus sp. NF TaxID=2608716 RepID=UPI0015A1D983|nr:YiiD C-terminal domain-containing protein [Mariprofundus sp. NF]